ncbi:hypothetical protein YPPY45_2659, partial [Yersinia pestis PY-45]|jgi:hypothetical protein
MYFL